MLVENMGFTSKVHLIELFFYVWEGRVGEFFREYGTTPFLFLCGRGEWITRFGQSFFSLRGPEKRNLADNNMP